MGTFSVWHLIVATIYIVGSIVPMWLIFKRIGKFRYLALLAPFIGFFLLIYIAITDWNVEPKDQRQ